MTILKNTFHNNHAEKTIEIESEALLQFHSSSRKNPGCWTVSTGNWALIDVVVKDEEALEMHLRGLLNLQQNDLMLCTIRAKSTQFEGVLRTSLTIEKLLKLPLKQKRN
jgi:hypothetical protein